MASTAGEDVDYESDPEEVKRSLGMRRREAASDDEEVEEEDAESDKVRMDRRGPIQSDESDGQGAAADYDDDEDELDIEEEEELEEEEEIYNEEDEYVDEEEMDGVRKEEIRAREGKAANGIDAVVDGMGNVVDDQNEEGEGEGEGEGEEEEKKENEPFAVPTAGAFYMHDDRFRENVAGRHRRMHGGRKLWESKDDRKWGHDKYEEIESQEKQYDEGRRPSRGRYRGRSRNHGPEHSYPRGRSRTFNKSSSENQMAKGVRGRGPRRYEPTFKRSSQATSAYNKQSGKHLDKSSQTNSTPAVSAESVSAAAKKNSFASSLNSASPPFYPSGSSNKDAIWTQKRDVQAGNLGRNNQPSTSVTEANYSHDNSLRGKNAVETLGMEKLRIDDSTISTAGRPVSTLSMHASVTTMANTGQAPNHRVQGRGLAMSGQMPYQQAPVQVQAKRVSAATQFQAVQQSPVQSKAQAYVQSPAQQLSQRPGTGSQASSSPPKTGTLAPYESREVEASSETSKSMGALVGKVKGSVQGTGKNSFMYGGAQVMGTTGSMTVNPGDPNFPTFLPVMQFGGQHPGGIGVPAVGMAFPGYVAQPQLGLGNSEMTWLPVLTGAAGALGATYCPPYLTADGSYQARPSGQPSVTGSSSKESNSNKPNTEWSSQRPEAVTDEFGHRPNNPNKQPRRYSEMSFSK